MADEQEVKGQPAPTGFQIHPENINKAGGPDKLHWWSQLYVDELELESAKRKGYAKKISVVRANIEKAEEGDLAAIKEIGDRVQGKAPQTLNQKLTGDLHVSVTNYGTNTTLPIQAAVVPITSAESD